MTPGSAIGALLGEVAFCVHGWVGKSGRKWKVSEQVDEKFGGS
jgi:hypothetical protein